MMHTKKKAQVGQIWSIALAITLTGIIVGVGVLLLDKFATTSGVTVTAATAINNSRAAVATISDSWMSLIVLVAVIGIILAIVLASFAGKMNR